jgi:hypothetical protein
MIKRNTGFLSDYNNLNHPKTGPPIYAFQKPTSKISLENK